MLTGKTDVTWLLPLLQLHTVLPVGCNFPHATTHAGKRKVQNTTPLHRPVLGENEQVNLQAINLSHTRSNFTLFLLFFFCQSSTKDQPGQPTQGRGICVDVQFPAGSGKTWFTFGSVSHKRCRDLHLTRWSFDSFGAIFSLYSVCSLSLLVLQPSWAVDAVENAAKIRAECFPGGESLRGRSEDNFALAVTFDPWP